MKLDTKEKEIVDLYESGLSLARITEYVDYKSPNTIKKILINNGIQLRTRAGFKRPFNESFFHDIDSEEKAYYLGYLMADGNVALRENSQPVVRMELHQKDRSVLEKLKELLDTDIEVKDTRKNCCCLRVHSRIMFNDLCSYGIVPNKTGREILPELEEPYLKHFIRGFFDGDGWFTNTTGHNGKNKRKNLGFCGNSVMLENIMLYFESTLHTNHIKITDRESYAMLIYGSLSDVNVIADYMYNGSTIFLERKHIAYLQ